MINGLYEKVMDHITASNVTKHYNKTRKIDRSESSKVLSLAYQKIIRELLVQKTDSEKVEFVNKLSQLMNVDGFQQDKEQFIELLSVHENELLHKDLNNHRPKTSIAYSTLFTGHTGPTLESELKREIRTADRVDFLISFIKFSGLRLIYEDLVEYTKNNKLRVITTSYMGASDYKAILEIAKLPNTQVKVSYDVERTRLHAKAYYFERLSGFSTAYIGSSNISNPALSNGLEWNLKVSEYTSKDVIDSVVKTFESYWNDDEFRIFDPDNNHCLIELKESLNRKQDDVSSLVFFDLYPYAHQKEILEDLRREREEYNSFKNLVVAATGTGKTMIAAFDYKEFIKQDKKKLLFLAHRKEILLQSLLTFRAVLKDQNFGDLWVDGEQPSQIDYVFASIQTLNSREKYKGIPMGHYDYIVIDESHHSSANSYLKILEHFQPIILLGLTATPERMDGKNIQEYFNHRIASEIRLADAIDRKLLSPFHYFGVTDTEHLNHLKWSRGGYEISELENVYTKSKQRVQIIIDSLNKYLKDMETFKAIGFCVSIKHADFMQNSFNKVGIKSISLHSGSDEKIRNEAKKKLQNGEINCIFTVDLFNEGVDIPDIDTVLFLRPTESITVFIQQLGRGLRISDHKDALTVLDFVGQAHANYDFSFKLRALIGKTRRSIKEEINDDFPNMPAGCHIQLERIAKDYIMNNIQATTLRANDLRRMMSNFSLNFDLELTLDNYLNSYGINKDQFYSNNSFYKLMFETGLKDGYEVKDDKELKESLRRFSRINSKRLLGFAEQLFKSDLDLSKLTSQEKLMLGMIHYTIWGAKSYNYEGSIHRLKQDNSDIVKESLDIINYNKRNLKSIEIPYEDESIPLDIYASYTIQQVMVAFGKTTENHEYPMRQGVLYVQDKNTDLFFVTINKNEEDYLPSTMYNDYAINNELFNWESQSTTSVNSPTGQRYIQDRSDDHKVLFFIRESKQEFGKSSPYVFLGNARYVSHKGSNPIQIIWKMDHPIPERIIRESSLRPID